jgi:hypothetical protein
MSQQKWQAFSYVRAACLPSVYKEAVCIVPERREAHKITLGIAKQRRAQEAPTEP